MKKRATHSVSRRAFTLLEMSMVMAIMTLVIGVVLSLTKVTADSYRGGLLRASFSDQARRINLALARDCTGPVYWQILDGFKTRNPGNGSAGCCLILAYSSNMDRVVPFRYQAGKAPADVRTTRVVCYYLDTSGGDSGSMMLRRIDSAEPRAGVVWPKILAPDAKLNLSALLPDATDAVAAAGAEVATIHAGQISAGNGAIAKSIGGYQLFYARANGAAVTINALLRHGSGYESYFAPVRFTVPVVR